MAAGIADDLATTLLLATDKPVLAAPAMNVRMWQHAATRRNVARLRADGVTISSPTRARWPAANMAPAGCPSRRRSSPRSRRRWAAPGPLAGRHVIVTAGPTHEPIDPVRVHRQPLVGQAGLRHRRGARRARRAGDPGRRAGRPRNARRASTGIDVETARRDGRRRSRRRCPPTPPSGRRGRRLAGRAGRREAQEGGRAARARLAAQSRHPRRPRRRSRDRPAPAGRLRRRDRGRRRQGRRPSARARAATGSSPTTCRAT